MKILQINITILLLLLFDLLLATQLKQAKKIILATQTKSKTILATEIKLKLFWQLKLKFEINLASENK